MCVAPEVITSTNTAEAQDLYSCKAKREIIIPGKFKYFQQDQRVEQRSVLHHHAGSGRTAWVIEMCNNCDRGRYLTHFFFPPPACSHCCVYTRLPSLVSWFSDKSTKVQATPTPRPPPTPHPSATTPLTTHSVISPAKGFFLTTRMWPHFICMSPHQSGQRPSSGRSLVLPDSCSHQSDKAQTRRPSNCLIGSSRRSCFFLTSYREDSVRVQVIWLIWAHIFSFCQSLLGTKEQRFAWMDFQREMRREFISVIIRIF